MLLAPLLANSAFLLFSSTFSLCSISIAALVAFSSHSDGKSTQPGRRICFEFPTKNRRRHQEKKTYSNPILPGALDVVGQAVAVRLRAWAGRQKWGLPSRVRVGIPKEQRRPKLKRRKRNDLCTGFTFFPLFRRPVSRNPRNAKTKMQNQPNAPSEILAAALENRAGEIGIAFLDTRRGR